MFSESDGSLRKRDVQDRRLSIIDVSSADDSLLDPLSGNPQHSENQNHDDLLYTPNSKKFEDAASKLEQWEHEPHTSEIGKTKKNTKCNLRKSLAWDSAFFTSAGVLDPEELSSIIEGVEKEALLRIEEDVYKSCESISTLESDSLTLESVEMEGDLFEDVRASIQKSSGKSNLTKVPSPSGLPRSQTHDSSRKAAMVSRNKIGCFPLSKLWLQLLIPPFALCPGGISTSPENCAIAEMKVPPASRNPSSGMQGAGKMTNKKNPIFPQLPQPVATRRESSIPKQSKVPGKFPSSTISSKRVSLGDLHVKGEKDRAKRIIGDRVSSVSKASVIGDSRRTVPKPTRPSRVPSGPLVSTKTKSATSTSSAARTPSRIASRNKTEPGDSSLSGLMSATKLSSSISPASSISDWSSESSSSISVAKHMCNSSRSSVDSSCSRKVLSDTNADEDINSQIPQSDPGLEGQEAQHTGFINQSARTAPGATVLPPALGKPSGLRLPSPKIGFFDGVKSSVRTPRGGMQTHSVVPRGLPKHGEGSSSEGQNKTKLAKLQPARSITSIEDTKPNSQQNLHPNPFHESLDVAIKTSSAVQNVKSSSDIPMVAVENTTPSHLVERTHYDLHPLKGVNQENAHYDNQIDCLSKQVGLIDINFETCEKFNVNSLSFSQTDASIQDKSNNGLELSSHKELYDCPKTEELLKGSSTPCLSVSPTSFGMAASTRRPFAVKDSFCNMDGSVFTERKQLS
ncbi:hypothetical protein SESBI_00023 [Sesbania bispinosa]|nr:hypothetical protein SESBI_00023 [Sesbania bispinosa]